MESTQQSAGSSAAGKNKKNLAIVLVMTATYLVAEVIGGIWTGSLALLADAGHMFTDVGGLALALAAIWFAERPASSKHTYGYFRVEIFAAFINALILILISMYILYEAYQRFQNPPEVESFGMLLVASIGLGINIIGMRILRGASKESLNMKGAYFEVLSDMLTSIGVILAGIIMLTTGWYYADPIISAGIGLFIFPRVWTLMKKSVHILLEGTPSDVNMEDLRESLNSFEGVDSVHDLHVWSLTSGMNAMSLHLVLEDGADHEDVLLRVQKHSLDRFGISHTTVQVDSRDVGEHETHF